MNSHVTKTAMSYNPRFVKYLQLFAALENSAQLFPKDCRTCGTTYRLYSEYVFETVPKAHVMEDCGETMKRPFTMMYRHCSCGNTLVLTLTDENFPELEQLWLMLKEEAARSGKTLKAIVGEFTRQCDHYIVSQRRNQR